MPAKLLRTGAVLVFILCAWFDHRTEQARLLRTLNAVTAEQVAREGKTDRAFYAHHPKHFPTDAVSRHPKQGD
ncbi:hypothetical protein JQ608_06910 [Bradyrhizobium liaoningense]|uniref:hypothetical protein n=1 Tax=Bradyrhizobium liaoningense TaxID=43992 RepID=UPI001BAAD8DB|nr:hypothetical protein [Bradyrhizobium liaoningense]MBR0876932.1 hypothetical protein [Bradyrhizobium liaoningense]